MFHKIFKCPFAMKRHRNGPLLSERLKFLQYYDKQGSSPSALKTIANYLLRIIELLDLENNKVITTKNIEKAANEWAHYQYNHPKKMITFSKYSKWFFVKCATEWLTKLGWLKLPAGAILFYKIFKLQQAINRHLNAPPFEERLKYLQYWADNGAVPQTLCCFAQYLLLIIGKYPLK